MMKKNTRRLRRAAQTRKKLSGIRLCVYKTPMHTYAQVIQKDVCGQSAVLCSANTLEQQIREQCSHTGNISAAQIVGSAVAARAQIIGISNIAFDRSGFKYHGRIKALAESARAKGLII